MNLAYYFKYLSKDAFIFPSSALCGDPKKMKAVGPTGLLDGPVELI